MEDPERIRREAEEYADAARRRADAFAEARIQRVRELSDRLLARAETVERRFAEAVAIKEQLDDLVAALAAAARNVAAEAADEVPDLSPPAVRRARGGDVRVQDVRGTPPPPA